MRGPWRRVTPRCRYESHLATTRSPQRTLHSGARTQLLLRWQRLITSQLGGEVRHRTREPDVLGRIGRGTGQRKSRAKTHSVPRIAATSSPRTTQCIDNDAYPHNRAQNVEPPPALVAGRLIAQGSALCVKGRHALVHQRRLLGRFGVFYRPGKHSANVLVLATTKSRRLTTRNDAMRHADTRQMLMGATWTSARRGAG